MHKRHTSRCLIFLMGVGAFTVFAPEVTGCQLSGSRGRAGASRNSPIASGAALDRALDAWLNDGQRNPSPSNGNAPVVGTWVTNFYFGTSDKLYDKSIQQFNPGGNEMMNSGFFPPAESNICFGIWKATGERTYRVRHMGWAFDSNGALLGIVRIVSAFTVTPQGDQYTGTYATDIIDLNGTVIPGTVVQGVIKARRFGGD